MFKKIINNCKGALDITGIVVDIALLVSLVPVIRVLTDSGKQYECLNPLYTVFNAINLSCGNLTDGSVVLANRTGLNITEVVLLSLVGLFIVLALVVMIVKQSGLGKKK